MSMGFLLEPDHAVIMRGPMLHGIMQQFLHQVDWGALDYLVIDLPPGTGDVPLTLAQSLPLTGAVVVCTPQEVALLDAVPGRRDVPPAQGADAGDGREHELLRRPGVPPGARRPRGPQLAENTAVLRRAGRRAGPHLRPRGGAGARPRNCESPSSERFRSTCYLRESGDEGKIEKALHDGSPSRPYLLGSRRAARRPDQHPEHQEPQDAEA